MLDSLLSNYLLRVSPPPPPPLLLLLMAKVVAAAKMGAPYNASYGEPIVWDFPELDRQDYLPREQLEDYEQEKPPVYTEYHGESAIAPYPPPKGNHIQVPKDNKTGYEGWCADDPFVCQLIVPALRKYSDNEFDTLAGHISVTCRFALSREIEHQNLHCGQIELKRDNYYEYHAHVRYRNLSNIVDTVMADQRFISKDKLDMHNSFLKNLSHPSQRRIYSHLTIDWSGRRLEHLPMVKLMHVGLRASMLSYYFCNPFGATKPEIVKFFRLADYYATQLKEFHILVYDDPECPMEAEPKDRLIMNQADLINYFPSLREIVYEFGLDYQLLEDYQLDLGQPDQKDQAQIMHKLKFRLPMSSRYNLQYQWLKTHREPILDLNGFRFTFIKQLEHYKNSRIELWFDIEIDGNLVDSLKEVAEFGRETQTTIRLHVDINKLERRPSYGTNCLDLIRAGYQLLALKPIVCHREPWCKLIQLQEFRLGVDEIYCPLYKDNFQQILPSEDTINTGSTAKFLVDRNTSDLDFIWRIPGLLVPKIALRHMDQAHLDRLKCPSVPKAIYVVVIIVGLVAMGALIIILRHLYHEREPQTEIMNSSTVSTQSKSIKSKAEQGAGARLLSASSVIKRLAESLHLSAAAKNLAPTNTPASSAVASKFPHPQLASSPRS